MILIQFYVFRFFVSFFVLCSILPITFYFKGMFVLLTNSLEFIIFFIHFQIQLRNSNFGRKKCLSNNWNGRNKRGRKHFDFLQCNEFSHNVCKCKYVCGCVTVCFNITLWISLVFFKFLKPRFSNLVLSFP